MDKCELHQKNIDTQFEMINNRIDDLGVSLRSEIRAKDDLIQMQLQKILDQTTKTNGRVNKLEEETKIIRYFSNHPKLAIVAGATFVVGILKLLELGWNKVIDLLGIV